MPAKARSKSAIRARGKKVPAAQAAEAKAEEDGPWSGEVKLYPCVPKDWLWLPRPLRAVLGWTSICLYTLCFLTPVYGFALLLPYSWSSPALARCHYVMLAAIVASYLAPMREWPAFRALGQLWYEIFQFSTNFAPKDCLHAIARGEEQQVILAMHPHGIVPFQAIMWASYCDQYFSDPATGCSMFGFGAAADAVAYLPFLRNWMGWVSAGSAAYNVLKRGLADGVSAICPTRNVRHLFVLPGGVAEIFTSTPGRNCIVFKGRTGLVRLALETGAKLAPVYVFGGTDFYHNLATSAGWLSWLSRRFKMGMTVFWGPFGQPVVPYTPRVTMALGAPIDFPGGYEPGQATYSPEMVAAYHEAYLADIQTLFDRHKEAAGYKDSVLEIL